MESTSLTRGVSSEVTRASEERTVVITQGLVLEGEGEAHWNGFYRVKVLHSLKFTAVIPPEIENCACH